MPEPQPHHDPHESIGNADSMIDYDYADRDLPVPLTDRERLEIAQDLASAQAVGEQAEKDKKAASDAFNGTIESAYADVSELAGRLRYGKITKPVRCQTSMNYRLGTVRVVRMDDGTELENRVMTKAERQMGMNFGGEKAH